VTSLSPIDSLLASKEHLPSEVRDAILAMGNDAVPVLVALLDDDDHCDIDSPSEGWAPAHAVGLLVDLKANEGIEPMLELLRDTEFDAVVHHRILVRLPELGIPVVEPALQLLEETRDNEDATRSLCHLLSELGVEDERIFDALTKLFENDAILGSMSFSSYGDSRALPLIRASIANFQPDFASDDWSADLHELLHSYEALDGIVDEELTNHLDSIAMASRKHMAASGRIDGVKVGRNDACPCGSGKKFKKCCLGAAKGA
jgi:hypothetical protein